MFLYQSLCIDIIAPNYLFVNHFDIQISIKFTLLFLCKNTKKQVFFTPPPPFFKAFAPTGVHLFVVCKQIPVFGAFLTGVLPSNYTKPLLSASEKHPQTNKKPFL